MAARTLLLVMLVTTLSAAQRTAAGSQPGGADGVCHQDEGFSYIGSNLFGDKTKTNSTATYEECCALCQQYAGKGCVFYQFAAASCYGHPSGCCRLKTADAWKSRAALPGAHSGSIKPLPPPPPPPPPGQHPYPGPNFTHPRIHQSPDCLHVGGWHDMAGALTFKGVHHAFQGCPGSGGWSHSSSTDLVHWKDLGRGVHRTHETFEGMDSTDVPCSGFVTVDDVGTPCAGFRQCSSNHGTTGLNPQAKPWDVPMELRCAENEALTNWSDPIWLYPVYYYRALPYDPVRPWKDLDGKWYSAWSTDGCNATTKVVPCAAGGQLELLTSPKLHGEGADWVQLKPMFTTNTTCSGTKCSPGAVTREFVTAGYFGGLAGDPDGGATRVVTQNNAGPTFWVGKQGNGSKFEAYWDKVGAVGHYDYGSLTMARTLGADPNQVATNGRRVLIGWIGGFWGPVSQSLPRDLSLSSDYELLQQFVPELKMLRLPGTERHTASPATATATSPAAAMAPPHSGNSGRGGGGVAPDRDCGIVLVERRQPHRGLWGLDPQRYRRAHRGLRRRRPAGGRWLHGLRGRASKHGPPHTAQPEQRMRAAPADRDQDSPPPLDHRPLDHRDHLEQPDRNGDLFGPALRDGHLGQADGGHRRH